MKTGRRMTTAGSGKEAAPQSSAATASTPKDQNDRDGNNGHQTYQGAFSNFRARETGIDMSSVPQNTCEDHGSEKKADDISETSVQYFQHSIFPPAQVSLVYQPFCPADLLPGCSAPLIHRGFGAIWAGANGRRWG
jgi:hypothetical protein